jgi:biopolymer transport protein ExbB/TolQ
MFDVLIKGGPILWIILALAIPVIAILIERLLYFKRIAADEDKLFARVKGAIEKGQRSLFATPSRHRWPDSSAPASSTARSPRPI